MLLMHNLIGRFTAVYRWNHDNSYNASLPNDNVEHVFIEKFEQFEDENFLKCFLSRHGRTYCIYLFACVEWAISSQSCLSINEAVDIVIGGPPCIDFSKVNSRRKGVHGLQGSYMLRFGKLIQDIQKYQRQNVEPAHRVFFMAENVKLDNDRGQELEAGNLEQIKKAFGDCWSVDIDAWLFSPGGRNRTYITNFPIFTEQRDYYVDQEALSCFSVNVIPCALRTNCFMASKCRLDDNRMMVTELVKQNEKNCKVLKRSISTEERERIMGFPSQYVEQAGVYIVVCLCICFVSLFVSLPLITHFCSSG
jgi:C-5 cytosine-specific DNA methylase